MLKTENLVEGVILYESWGYEQTNIDFYQVVRTSGKSIWLRPINSKVVKTGANYSYWIEPVKDDFKNDDKPIRKLKSPYISVNSFGVLSIYENSPLYETNYY